MTDALALFDADLTPATEAIAEPVAARPARRPLATDRGAKPTLLAVDGNALVHRAFHAYRGTTGGARYGFFALLSVVCDQVAYDGLVIGFDCRARSHRRARYADYKAQRPDKHEQLDAALDELPTIAADMGAYVVVAEGWEGDDVVASAATVAEAAGWACVVASPDRDLLALVSRDTVVLQVGAARPIRRVTAADFRRRHRISPQQYLQLAALRGDASDNLPGITGIGAKKAAELLRTYATVADAVADPLGCRSVLGPELGQALIDDLAAGDASVFRRNVDLMTLHREVPIDLARSGRCVTPDEILTVLRRWRMTGLHARMCAALAVRPDHAEAPPVSDDDVPDPAADLVAGVPVDIPPVSDADAPPPL